MGKFIKIITIILLSMLITTTSVVAETEKTIPVYETYTFFGDSIAAGHSLADYESYVDNSGDEHKGLENQAYGDGHLIKESYPQLVYDGVGATNVNCLAMSGFSTSALRYMFDDTYEMDDITAEYLSYTTSGNYTVEDYKDMREPFRQAVKDSDLITIGVGSNDYLFSAIDGMYKVGTLLGAFDEYLKPSEEEIANRNKLTTKISNVFKVIKMFNQIKKDSYNNFSENWDETIKLIREINPDVKIVVVSLYNPMRDMKLSEDSNFKVGKLLNPIIKKANKFLQKKAKTKDEYTFIDVSDVEVYEMFTLADAANFTYDFFDKLTHSIHPTPAGHKEIADKILKSLEQ